MTDSLIEGLDDVIHGKLRLGIMAYLASAESASFSQLKAATGATDGNLSVHLRKLEDANYVDVNKRFEGRKPLTTVSLTKPGRTAWAAYLKRMQDLISGQPGAGDH